MDHHRLAEEKSKRTALILSGLGIDGYGILRSLARKGVPVVGTTDRAGDPGRFSRYCKRSYVYCSSILDPRGYFYSSNPSDYQALCALLLKWRSEFDHNPILFATGDPFALFLANFGEELSAHYEYHWVPRELHWSAINKDHMSILCQQAGIPGPRTHITRPDEDVQKSARDFSFPCLVKPVQRFISGFPTDRKNFVADSLSDLIDFYRHYPGAKGTTIWQEILEGGDGNNFQCTLLIKKSGELGGVFCTRKLHHYPPFGVMSYGRSEQNEVVISQALKLVRFLGYRGIAAIEFKYQPRDGRYYFIELNARWPRSNGYFQDAGLNLQYLTYLDLTDAADDRAFQARQRDGVYWTCALEEGQRHWKARKGFRLGILPWVRLVARADCYAYWYRRDPVPFLIATLQLCGAGIRKLARICRGLITKKGKAV